MRTPQGLCVAILLLLLPYNEVLAFTLSVPSDKVAIGQTFPLSWTSTSNDQQNVDICLSTNTQFLPIGSIQRSGALAGTVDVTVNSNISPGTYLLGIRLTGCAFLFAQDLNPFVVTAPTPPSTTHGGTSAPPSPPHTTSETPSNPSASPTPTTSAVIKSNSPAARTSSNSSPQPGNNTGSAASVTPTAPSQTSSQTTSVDTLTQSSSNPLTTPTSRALGKTESIWGKGMLGPFAGCIVGVLASLL